MFYSFFNAQENVMMEHGLQSKFGFRTKMETARAWMWIIIIPAMLGYLAREKKLPDSFGEAMEEILMYRLAGKPYIRDAASAVFGNYDYQFSPVIQAGKQITDIGKEGVKLFGDEGDFSKFGKESFEASGYLLGIPSAQALITAQGFIDLNNGYTTDLTRLLFRAPRENEEE
jgi:hypothetical protein